VLGGSGAHDADVFIGVRAGAVTDLDLGDGGDVVVVVLHAEGSALVDVHGAGVHGGVGTGGVHCAQHPAGCRFDHLDWRPSAAAQVGQIRGGFGPVVVPVPAGGPTAQEASGDQVAQEWGAGRAEAVLVCFGQWHFGCCCAQMRGEYEIGRAHV